MNQGVSGKSGETLSEAILELKEMIQGEEMLIEGVKPPEDAPIQEQVRFLRQALHLEADRKVLGILQFALESEHPK